MLNLYGPVFQWRAACGNPTAESSASHADDPRRTPTTADQILFLLENTSSLKGLRRKNADAAQTRAA